MHTQKYIQVEEIVNKYKTFARNQINHEEVISDTSFPGGIIVVDTSRFVEQVLAHFYFLAAGDKACFESNLLTKYANDYINGILTESEELFLLENFDFLTKYIIEYEAINHPLTISSLSECGVLIPHILNNNCNLRIFLENTDNGAEIEGIKNSHVTIGDDNVFAIIRAFVNGLDVSSLRLSQKEFINNKSLQDCSFDVVISDGSFIDSTLGVAMNHFNAAYRLVREGGELIYYISKDVLLGEESYQLRKFIKESRQLCEIIMMPYDVVLLHLEKKEHDLFFVADATECVRFQGPDGIAKIDVERFKRLVSISDQPEFEEKPIVRKYAYDFLNTEIFLPSFYLSDYSRDMKISDYAKRNQSIITSEECSNSDVVVTINNLSDSFSKTEFKLKDLKKVDLEHFRRYHVVNGPCIVIAVSKKSIKVGYTLENGRFLVPKNLEVLIAKPITDCRYLACAILEKKVIGQITSIVIGTGNSARLCNNWETLISLSNRSKKEEQNKLIEQTLLSELGIQEKMAENAAKSYKHAIHLRKHALSQNFSAFDSMFRTLEKYSLNHRGIHNMNDKVSPVSSMTVSDVFAALRNNLDEIRLRVAHLAEDQDWGECVVIDPRQFIIEYENLHIMDCYSFDNLWDDCCGDNLCPKDYYDKTTGKLLISKGEIINAAWFPKNALIQVFDNIISNAREHGFTNVDRKDYKISFSWDVDDFNIKIRIANNGTPMSNEIDTLQVFDFGYSSALNKNGHGGIGGGEMAEIMHKYGGDISIVSTPDKKNTVTYILTLPLASRY